MQIDLTRSSRSVPYRRGLHLRTVIVRCASFDEKGRLAHAAFARQRGEQNVSGVCGTAPRVG